AADADRAVPLRRGHRPGEGDDGEPGRTGLTGAVQPLSAVRLSVRSASEMNSEWVPSFRQAKAPATRPASRAPSRVSPRRFAHRKPETNASPAPLESTGRHVAHSGTAPLSSATGSSAP